MTDFAPLLQPDRGEPAHALHLVDGNSFEAWRKSQPERIAAAIDAQRFTGKGQELAILPGERTDEWSAALGVANVDELSPWCLATAAERLSAGNSPLGDRDSGLGAPGLLLAQERFEIGRAPVLTPVTNAVHVCLFLQEIKKSN